MKSVSIVEQIIKVVVVVLLVIVFVGEIIEVIKCKIFTQHKRLHTRVK